MIAFIVVNSIGSKTKENWKLIILHSMVSGEDQRAIFKPSEPGSRKIILSTNIAESSITVPDIKYGEQNPRSFCVCELA